MGRKAEQPLELTFDDLYTHLRANHSVYMEYDGKLYYITDVNNHHWRVQDTTILNEKGHYTDCSELVYLLNDFLSLSLLGDKSIRDIFPDCTFYASEN